MPISTENRTVQIVASDVPALREADIARFLAAAA
jgi:hypothetical protein